MDDVFRKEMLREEVRRKHKGGKLIPAKYRMKYPDSAEREYVRLTDAYMTIEQEVLVKYIPELKQILNGDRKHADSKKGNEMEWQRPWTSTVDKAIILLDILFGRIQNELEAAFGLYGLKEKLDRIAGLDHKLTIAEWKKVVNKTLGINLLDDYYSGEYYKKMLKKWVSENVDLIKSVPQESLKKLKKTVYRDYMDGRSTTDIVKGLQRQYGMDKHRARLIARDQTAKLNADITQSQQRDAGVSKYRWSDSADVRVRACHKALNGKIFSWDDPPEMWYKTKNGIVYTGRHCHPGQDYQCRCCALPVFDIDTLDLPV